MPPFRPRRSLRPLRPRLPRRALPWYAAAALLTVLTAVFVHGALQRATASEAAYGATQPVVVATTAVAVGDTLDPSVATVRSLPRAVVPDGALAELPDGRRSLVALARGEILLHDRVSGSDAAGPAGLLAPDQRAVPVPIAVPGLPLAVGDRVDLVAGGAPGGGVDGDLPIGPTEPDVVAADALVLVAEEETVVVAVPAPVAAEIAMALTTGPLVPTLRPP
ncbi:MAG TPA: SAF domain-containing protein [Iamia sp.]|nr:SAF domain-containing protein [Iamia sp.]